MTAAAASDILKMLHILEFNHSVVVSASQGYHPPTSVPYTPLGIANPTQPNWGKHINDSKTGTLVFKLIRIDKASPIICEFVEEIIYII